MKLTNRNRLFYMHHLLVLVLFILIPAIAGCGQKSDKQPATENAVPSDDGDAGKSDSTELKQEQEKDPDKEIKTGATSYEMSYDRILPGLRCLNYIKDDGSLEKLLDVGEDATICYADACSDFFAVVARVGTGSDLSWRLNLIYPDGSVSAADIYRAEENGSLLEPNSFAIHDNRFAYNLLSDSPTIYIFDRENNKFVPDMALTGIQTLIQRQIDNTGKNAIVYGMCAPAALERTGEIMLESGEGLYFYDENGTETDMWEPPVMASWFVPFSRSMLFGVGYDYSSESTVTNCYVYNTSDRSMRKIALEGVEDIYDSVVNISDDGRFVYYLADETDVTGHVVSQSLYRMQIDGTADEPDMLFKTELPVGFDNIAEARNCGRALFKNRIHFCGDDVYYLDYVTDRGFVWMKKRVSDSSKPMSTEVSDSDLPFSRFGTLTAETDARALPELPEYIYYHGRYERMSLNNTFPKASVINKAIDEFIKDQRGIGDDMAASAEQQFSSGDADWMLESNIAYYYELSFVMGREIAGRYLELQYNGYEYWGGAHGMPMQFFLLFDEETGERLTIRNIFAGNNRNFKEIVTEYAMEDWRRGEEYRYYNGYDPDLEDTQRAVFMDASSLDMDVEFKEDGIIAYFSPYAVAPFASGFVGVNIPYEALGFDLRNGVTRIEKEDNDTRSYVIECPEWDAPYQSDDIHETMTSSPIELTEVSIESTDWLDSAMWSDRTGIELPDTMYGGAHGSGEIRDDRYIYMVDNTNPDVRLTLEVYSVNGNDLIGIYDFSGFLNTPVAGNEFTVMEIPYAKIYDDILYVELAHRTYSADQPYTAYILALEVETGKLLWRSNFLVANGHNFVVGRDTIICGYGFTNEDDYLYILSRHSGAVLEKIKLRTGPDYFIPLSNTNTLFVITYDTAYEYHVEEK